MWLFIIINLTLPGVRSHGDRICFYDARSLGMGCVTAVLENGYNPAAIGLHTRGEVLVSGSLLAPREKRGLRVYDSYGNNMGISTIASNSSFVTNIGASSLSFPFSFLKTRIQYAPLWDFYYAYYYEYMDDFYQVTRIEEKKYTGYIWSFAPALALNYRLFNVGVEYALLYGHRYQEDKIIVPGSADTITTNEYHDNGSLVRFGILVNPNPHFRITYYYSSKHEITGSNYQNISTYPDIHTGGFFYQPAGRIPTVVVGELNYERWQEANMNSNIFIYRIGVEHSILNTYKLRYGFLVFPDYKESAIWTTSLTIGAGITTPQYNINIGYGFHKRDYQSTQYPALDVNPGLHIDESLNAFLLSLCFKF